MMKAYLKVFIDYKQNNYARFLLIAEFAYNNIKNASNGNTIFELNHYKKDINSHFKLKLADEQSMVLKKQMIVYKKNLYYAQKLQKQVYEKIVKLRR